LGDDEQESLCTESSWDPDEDDEKEVEDTLMNEADKKRRQKMKQQSSQYKTQASKQEDDPYGYEDNDYDDE
jgi:hypothetical protein